jgi:hypothetical protein
MSATGTTAGTTTAGTGTPTFTMEEARLVELLQAGTSRIDEQLLQNPDFRRIISLIIEPPKATKSLNASEFYANAKLERQQKLERRNASMARAEQIQENKALYEYNRYIKKQKEINNLKSIFDE